MTFDDTRDNATDIEDTIIEADDRADYDAGDGANGYDEGSVAEALFGEKHFGGDDIEEDDGQPGEYTEWQDYFGGDEYYDHSENEGW